MILLGKRVPDIHVGVTVTHTSQINSITLVHMIIRSSPSPESKLVSHNMCLLILRHRHRRCAANVPTPQHTKTAHHKGLVSISEGSGLFQWHEGDLCFFRREVLLRWPFGVYWCYRLKLLLKICFEIQYRTKRTYNLCRVMKAQTVLPFHLIQQFHSRPQGNRQVIISSLILIWPSWKSLTSIWQWLPQQSFLPSL